MIQIKEGIIPASSLQRLDWMYQDRTAANQGSNDSEKFLLGEAVKTIPGQATTTGKETIDPMKRIMGQIGTAYACPENEAFLKMMEDPMVYIKQKELE